ncbi:MAG: hypothetical protein R3B40_11005 [Polyangiales bacterium]|nr:hypothetical protein [Myxococcales bacterium]MCB9658019.1 hypothetical protein [Sandaracinaceae bacterium]
MHTHSARRFALALLLWAATSPPARGAAQNVRGPFVQLELGGAIAAPIAAGTYSSQARYGGGDAARVALGRDRFAIDLGVDAGAIRFDEDWDGWRVDEVRVVRVRGMVGARYTLVWAEHTQLYGRLGVGVERRSARYDLYLDDIPRGRRQHSRAAVIDPALALRLGSARRFALLQVGLPMALHTKQLVRPYGDSGNALAVELVMSVFAGWSWSI